MSTLTEQFEADVRAVQDDMPVDFTTVSQVTRIGQRDVSRVGLRMMEAGYDARRRTNLIVIVSDFTSEPLPVTNDLITMDGLLWRVEEDPTYSQDGVTVDLPLVQSN